MNPAFELSIGLPESLRDYLEVVDALYRFGSGIDDNDPALLASAFTPHPVLDFGPCEPTHLPPDDHTRRCQMKNRYTTELVRDGARWRIRRLTIDNAWFVGDPQVVVGK